MAASLKTPNYDIPIYQAGDTANYLTSYNNGMSIIDTQMAANAAAASAADAKGQQAITAANANALAIQELETATLKPLTSLSPTTITANGYFGGGSYLWTGAGFRAIGNLNFFFNAKYADIPTKVSYTYNNVAYYMFPICYVSGNIFGLTDGAQNYDYVGGTCLRHLLETDEDSATSISTLCAWLSGNNTYFGITSSVESATASQNTLVGISSTILAR